MGYRLRDSLLKDHDLESVEIVQFGLGGIRSNLLLEESRSLSSKDALKSELGQAKSSDRDDLSLDLSVSSFNQSSVGVDKIKNDDGLSFLRSVVQGANSSDLNEFSEGHLCRFLIK